MLTVKRLYATFAAALAGLLLVANAHAADTNLPTSGQPPLLWDGTGFNLERTPLIYKTVNATVITSQTTVWTPATNKRFLLMGFCISEGVATGAITLKDGAATIFIIPQNTLGLSQCFDFPGNGILSSAENNLLSATGVSTETITGTFFGTEEN